MPIEPLGGTLPALVLPTRRRVPGGEVPQQRPRAAVESARREGAVKVLALVEVAVHPAHLAIEHVTGAVPAGVAVGDRPARPLLAQGHDLLQDDTAEVLGRPPSQRAEPLPEAPAVGRMVRLPDPPRDLREQLPQVLGPVADLE